MENFTADNTEGFTSAELGVMNAAFDNVWDQLADADDEDQNYQLKCSLSDAFNNAWIPGATVPDLVASVGLRLGVAT